MPSLASQLLHGDLSCPGPSTWWGGAGQGSSRAPASCLLSALGHLCPHLHRVPYKGRAVFSYKSPTGGQTHSYQPSFSGGFLKCSFKAQDWACLKHGTEPYNRSPSVRALGGFPRRTVSDPSRSTEHAKKILRTKFCILNYLYF